MQNCNAKLKNILKTGFTLIEILVVVAIIGILTTIGISSYNNFNEKRKVRRAAEELKLYIRLAASKAINNEKDTRAAYCGSGDTNPLSGWFVDLRDGHRKIYGMCGSDNECDSTGTSFGNKSFDKGIGISGDVGGVATDFFCFYPLAGGTDLPGTLTISVDEDGEDIELIVDPSGNVSN